jgi:ATP-dependent helicase HrpA
MRHSATRARISCPCSSCGKPGRNGASTIRAAPNGAGAARTTCRSCGCASGRTCTGSWSASCTSCACGPTRRRPTMPRSTGASSPGMLSHIGQLDEQGRIPRAAQPGASACSPTPRWPPRAALGGGGGAGGDGRVWGRMAAAVEPGWIESAGAHLLRRSWSDPHWQAARGFVAAREQVSLFGLVLAANRRVDYARVDRAAAHEIFLRDALAAGHLRTRGRFLAHNRRLVQRVQHMEAKLRRRELLAGDEALARFLRGPGPGGDLLDAAFERWRKQAEKADAGVAVHVARRPADRRALARRRTTSPTSWTGRQPAAAAAIASIRRRGRRRDAGTAAPPAARAGRGAARLAGAGLAGGESDRHAARPAESARRRIVPVPDHARACLALDAHGQGRLHAALAEALRHTAGLEVEPETWAELELEPWMKFRVEVRDDEPAA